MAADDGFITVTKGHRLCARKCHSKDIKQNSINKKDFLNQDAIYKRILRRK